MKQNGFTTILGLFMILIVVLIVKGIQESEANHAREISNFELEQTLQYAAESAIIEAIDNVRNEVIYLPYTKNNTSDQIHIVDNQSKTINDLSITIDVWGERGKIYQYKILSPYNTNSNKQIINFDTVDEADTITGTKDNRDGVYIMALAKTTSNFDTIYRRAYAYFIDDKSLTAETKLENERKIYFMELP